MPAAAGAREPSLFATQDGGVLLSWTEPTSQGFAVRFAVGTGAGWSEPRTVTQGTDMFVNWADFPSIAEFSNGTLIAHWLQKNGGASYAYDVNIALSKDGGRSWSKPLVPHRDHTQRQHGFVSLLPISPDRLTAFWLDGRNYSSTETFATGGESSQDAMALRSVDINSDGVMSEETVLDPRTCTCCQTSAAVTTGGTIVVAYRDRSPDEIRDISVVRLVGGHWTKPSTVNVDGWRIEGCPVNGPAIDSEGKRVGVAWFSAASDIPQVNVAFSDDEGATFGSPTRLDRGSPEGRVDLLLLPDGSALVSWLEITTRGEELLLCRVSATAPCERPMRLFANRRGRTSGFPRMVRSGDNIYFAWTQPSQDKSTSPELNLKVRTVVAKLRISP